MTSKFKIIIKLYNNWTDCYEIFNILRSFIFLVQILVRIRKSEMITLIKGSLFLQQPTTINSFNYNNKTV